MLKKRIPTIVGIILLIIGAFIGVIFVGQQTDFLPRAAPEYVPQQVKITNVTDNGFTISWVTQEPTIGFVKFGESENNLDVTVVDERDQLTGDSGEYRTHYISVLGLNPETTYYAKLGSQGKRLYDQDGKPVVVTTGPNLGTPPPADSAYGTVMTPVDTPAEGAIVYIAFSTGTDTDTGPLSALVKQNGNWATNLSTARTADKSNYATYDPQASQLDLLARADTEGNDGRAVTTTDNDQPVPPIILGQYQDFTSQADSTSSLDVDLEATASASTLPIIESQFSLLPVEITDDQTEPIRVNTIPRDGVVVKSNQPEITGSAPPNVVLTITVHSSQIYTGTVSVNESGTWNWQPPATLEPGEHILTVSYNDEDGVLHTITRVFVVPEAQASTGDLESPSYTATPSASPTTSPTSTPSPTSAPTDIPSATPTAIPTPTPIPTDVPTPTIKPTSTATPSALPEAGWATPTYALGLVGLLLVFLGGGLLVNQKRYSHQ